MISASRYFIYFLLRIKPIPIPVTLHRTPIKGYAEALLDDPDDADARERFVKIIHRQAERMERLVKDLLRLARIEALLEQQVGGSAAT